MPFALDLTLLTQLPPELRAAVEAQMQALAVETDLRQHGQAENAELCTRNLRLVHLVRELQRARFGPRSEKLPADQLELAFEDIEVAIAAATEGEAATEARTGERPARTPRGPRCLPKDLPRQERVIEPADLTCPCGCGPMVRIGEDRSERLDLTPAQFRVIVTIRPRLTPARRAAPASVRPGRCPP